MEGLDLDGKTVEERTDLLQKLYNKVTLDNQGLVQFNHTPNTKMCMKVNIQLEIKSVIGKSLDCLQSAGLLIELKLTHPCYTVICHFGRKLYIAPGININPVVV